MKHFWFRFIFWLCAILAVCTLGISVSVSVLYANNGNQEKLKNLQNEAQQTQRLMIKNVKLLTSHLISMISNSNKEDAHFTFVGVADRKTGQVVSIHPARYTLKNLRVSTSDLTVHPVAFKPFNLSYNQLGRTLFLVDRNRIRSVALDSKQYSDQIIFGLLSPKGFSILSQAFNPQRREGFIVQSSSQWVPIHSQKEYSGQFLPPKYSVEKLKKSKGWAFLSENKEKLSVGIPMGIMNSYLVLNTQSQSWNQHFMAVFYEVSFVMLFAGVMILLLSYLFFRPIREAYQYLYWWINSFKSTNSLPIPNSNKKNIYIQKVQQGMSRLFMRLRENQFSQIETEPSFEMFSDFIQKVCESQPDFSGVKIQYQFDADIKLKKPLYWLEQSLLEIIKNAKESMESLNQIHIDISTFKEDQMFCCTIRDYGPGMGSLLMNQACKAYYTSKPNAKGLGLTLAYSSLSRAGCRLYFQNMNEGKGLEVQISIPLSKEFSYSVSHDAVYDS